MHRRKFLMRALQAGAVLPLASTGLFARPMEGPAVSRRADAEDRVLVLINLNGGNDGLNMVAPVNDQLYHDARPTLRLRADETLPITDGLALHGAIQQLHKRFGDGECAILQSVGYPDQDRSHFRSTDIWHTASDADKVLRTGWLGRYLESSHPDYPSTLPAAPFAMQIGASATLALQGENGSLGMAIDNPDRFYNLARGLAVPDEWLPDTLAGPELKYVRDVIAQSNRYSTGIGDAMLNGSTNTQYDGDSLSSQLRVVARLINGGLRTGIYVVSLVGFDTHYGQLPLHSILLTRLSRAVNSFLEDVATAGNGDRVVCMTYSEFGRRVNENGSSGTDHGAAAPQLVIGRSVRGGTVLGGTPDLAELDERGDIRLVHDFRQIYATVLQDWLGFAPSATDETLGGSFERLPLFAAPAAGVLDEQHARMAGYALEQNIPNPVASLANITFTIPERAHVRITLFTAAGRAVATMADHTLEAGRHTLKFNAGRLPAGSYLYIMECGRYRISRKMAVVR